MTTCGYIHKHGKWIGRADTARASGDRRLEIFCLKAAGIVRGNLKRHLDKKRRQGAT